MHSVQIVHLTSEIAGNLYVLVDKRYNLNHPLQFYHGAREYQSISHHYQQTKRPNEFSNSIFKFWQFIITTAAFYARAQITNDGGVLVWLGQGVIGGGRQSPVISIKAQMPHTVKAGGAPVTWMPFLSHEMMGGGSPVAEHCSSSSAPRATVMVSGASTMWGGDSTRSSASGLTAVPYMFLARGELNVPPLYYSL